MAVKYASIIIDISHENVDRIFQYRIPQKMLEEIRAGSQVCVPFGSGNRIRKGYVVDITEKAEFDPSRIKEITSLAEGSVTVDTRLIELAWWMKEQYGSTMNQALKTVIPVKKRVKARNKKVVWSMVEGEAPGAGSFHGPCSIKEEPCLNQEQKRIVEEFCQDYDKGIRNPCLIHGITGSGKTEVYIAMIRHMQERGKQVILLIPEIALTYQTVMRFYKRFGERISVMHSRLSAGERYDQLERAKRGETDIMIGARSALFTPFERLGLIIIDEEHEGAYQSESAPRYHAREVAEHLAEMSDAGLVLGSATPSLEAFSKAESGIYKLFSLKNRASTGSVLAATEVVDLRREMAEGNKSVFSRRLQELMKDRLGKGEQIMLFMNRRGYSSFVSCRSCGKAIKCPHCDVSLTLHNNRSLVCHYCGYRIPMPTACPFCGSEYLAGFGIGTQKVEEMARQLFPGARILRMDLDTTSKKGGHEKILSAFSKGKADILIGTQMIVKGHDFPGVTLVGILAADVSLYAPDFRCAERTFQLLVQASGRAGRGEKPGIAVIQTYIPEHYGIRTAAEQDYRTFYRLEMGYRKMMNYPPTCHLLKLQVAGEDEALTGYMMDRIRDSVVRHFGSCTEVIGPNPAPVYKVNDIYRKILYIKQGNYDILIRIRKYVQDRWDETEDCRRLTIQFDFS
ncbi:MAG: primosomal protein N' [Lachnospiraceae bacterium]|jgi:primosomal protein N' (replication factor Y)|nr:primosomal protein N' [Lachnospiraceae bacterium]